MRPSRASVAHAVGECDAHVGALDPIGDSDAARTAGRLVAELRYADLDEWLDGDLEGVLADLHERVARLSDAVAARSLRPGRSRPLPDPGGVVGLEVVVRIAISYRSVFSYDEAVAESHNELRACPRSSRDQRLVSYRVTTEPSSRVFSYTDYWGTRVDTFGIRAPHHELVVTAESVVETAARPQITSAPEIGQLADPAFRRAHTEWLEPTPLTGWDGELAVRAREVADTYGPDLVAVVLGIHRLVRSSVRYRPGTTDVATTAAEVWRQGEGVCQDQAHVRDRPLPQPRHPGALRLGLPVLRRGARWSR